ncbi:MAG: hypothetical protein U0M06_02110, partial [Clostridia bacterium]|nr:hypothetical protein [Clostridia bacterium]
MKKLLRLNLQLFAGEGASGTGEGGGQATSGENATVAAEQRLRELGVPEDKIRKRASKVASNMPTQTAKTEIVEQKTEETKEQSAPADTPTEETQGTPARMSWDEIMKDPEYNKQMQAVVQSRLKSAKTAEENFAKLTPALELLARKYNLDPSNMDYDALTKAINDDDGYYEDIALEMGVSVETAKKIDMQGRNTAREKAQSERTLREQMIQQHIDRLEQQGNELKKVFPNFDLRKELENPAFARMTAPGKGIMSVEDAYHAVHRNEIQTAAMQVTAQKTAEKISNAIQAGSRRPDESGTSSQGPSSVRFDYSKA